MDVPRLATYALRLGKSLDRELIKAQWETILRLIVSLKQKHVPASTVLKRLNSYSQHHPLYLALRELGRAVRTEFLLRYIEPCYGVGQRSFRYSDPFRAPRRLNVFAFYAFRYASASPLSFA